MKLFFVAALLLAVLGTCSSKIYNRCELARLMAANRFPKEQLPDWMCLVQYESGFNTTAVRSAKKNRSKYYGLFQLQSAYHCNEWMAGNECHLKCSTLLDDDISNDMRCARSIYRRSFFNSWEGWRNNCQGKQLPGVAECFATGK
uniref:Glycosyl hydrolases family 22 (GH22) domain-containing protein n=1 Tax=Anopheles melas TaxID=34690 RepID=A0A1I8JV34_9DIPT